MQCYFVNDDVNIFSRITSIIHKFWGFGCTPLFHILIQQPFYDFIKQDERCYILCLCCFYLVLYLCDRCIFIECGHIKEKLICPYLRLTAETKIAVPNGTALGFKPPA